MGTETPQSEQNPRAINTHHVLKLVALVTMTIDHVGAFFFPDLLWLRAIGRLSAPIWFFLIGQAPEHSVKHRTLYWATALAILSPCLGLPIFPLNVLFSLMVCQLLLQRANTKHISPLLLLPGLVCLAAVFLLLEYSTVGLLYALTGYAVGRSQVNWRSGKLIALCALAMYLPSLAFVANFTLGQYLFIGMGCAGLTWYFTTYQRRSLTVPRLLQPLQQPGIFLARHSLHYYVLHRLLFQAVAIARGTLQLGLRWF